MDSGATEPEIFEKKIEKKLQDPTADPIALPLEFLEVITCDFSLERELGRGAYGVVYKGVLQSGKVIAVKKIFDAHLLDLDNNKNNKQFENEITNLMRVRHQNVVQLVGYCVQTRKEVMMLPSGEYAMVEKYACLLCFEFLCKGSLDKHISDDFSVLDWDIRYEIIRGVCRGLHYLHEYCHIVHLDLKPQNILMDAAMMPKIADFGLSRLLGEQKSKTVTKKLAGTLGYMAQEYIDHGIISSKADIFSLGVIIIEIITNRRDYPNIGERSEKSLKHYIEEVVGSWRNRLEITSMHMSLKMHIQQVEQCIYIALRCLEPDSKKRPTSLYIVQSLNAEEPKCRSLGKQPIVVEKDRRQNKNLRSLVNMNIINIPNTIGAISGLNECANLFQWVTSSISSLKSQSNETQKERFQGDICQLHSDLQVLTNTLPEMYNLIDQAEWRIHDHYVADRLSKLKDVVYDAEELVDEFRWYEKKVSVDGNSISVEPIIDFFRSVTQGSFNKVTNIHERLKNLSNQLEKMGLLQAVPQFDKSFRPETTAFPVEAKMFGRDEEKKKLIMLLGVPTNNSLGPSGRKRTRSGVSSSASNQIYATTDSNEATKVGVQVLPIVGIGGVGKTTLAQDICNNAKVKHHFDLIIWICVSDDFDVKRLTKEAIEQSNGKVLENGNLNFLQGALADRVNKKRLLIVLDDMWDENELHWKHFCAPFRNVLQGSMMLVTTRSPKVADVVCTMDPFPLEGLCKDSFWEFFKVCAFGSNSSNIDPELELIGKKILPKLRGSPLAAKTLGRLLRRKLDSLHWNGILNSELWEHRQEETDILPALRLSYMYLPLYLKRCFSFCAVYPKDYIFEKEDLAEIWVAEGLVEHQPNIPLHHAGGQYFEELAHLSFFQKYPWSPEKYVIHDLMHDMAQLVSKDECFTIKDTKDLLKIPKNVRHLSVLKGGDVKCSDLLNLCKHRKLRTLLCNMCLESEIGNIVMDKWCDELLCMRVMVCSSISKWGLPGNLSNMKHLRYLKILTSCLCKTLPADLFCLYNMQILYAKKWDIVIPSRFCMLINLQQFESVKCQLHHIHSAGILNSATNQWQRSQFKLKDYNSESVQSWFHPQKSEQIHSYDYDSTFSSLTDVQIRNCQHLSSLEQFLQPAYVPIIKNIKISVCENLQCVPTDRFEDLCFLEVLHVSHCPKIKSQHLFAPSLKELYLENSGNLGHSIECSSLTIFHLQDCPLESIELQLWNVPLLQELKIIYCPSLTIIKDSEIISSDLSLGGATSNRNCRTGKFPLLAQLTIVSCDKLETIDNLIYLSSIESIKISACGLLSLPANRLGCFPHMKDLDISMCGSLNWKSGMLLPLSLQNLVLWNCGDFSAWFPSCLENLSSLEELQICFCQCIVSVPGHLWRSNLKSLKGLKFLGCSKLKSIGGPDAILHIRDLFIDDCPELKEINQPMKRGSLFYGGN